MAMADNNDSFHGAGVIASEAKQSRGNGQALDCGNAWLQAMTALTAHEGKVPRQERGVNVIASSETSPSTTPLLRVKPDERLDLPAPLKRRRFLLLFVACLLIHALILFFLILEDRIASAIPTPEEEISVEVVNEPPPPQQQAEQ